MWDKLKEQLKQLGVERELEEELRSGFALEYRLAVERQKRIAKANRNLPRRGVDGLGQTTMSMDPFLRSLADVRFGRHWMADRATRRRFLQEHPEFVVPYMKKAMIAVPKPGDPPAVIGMPGLQVA